MSDKKSSSDGVDAMAYALHMIGRRIMDGAVFRGSTDSPRGQIDALSALVILRTPGLVYVSQDGKTVYRLTGDGADLSRMPAAERTYLRGLLAEVTDDVIDQRDEEVADRLGSAGPARGHHADKVIVDDVPAGVSQSEWDHFAICGPCRELRKAQGIAVPPWYGNRSAG